MLAVARRGFGILSALTERSIAKNMLFFIVEINNKSLTIDYNENSRPN